MQSSALGHHRKRTTREALQQIQKISIPTVRLHSGRHNDGFMIQLENRLRRVPLRSNRVPSCNDLREVIIPQRRSREVASHLKQNAMHFCCGSMFAQPSEIFDFRLRREVIIPQRGSHEAASPLEQMYPAVIPCPLATKRIRRGRAFHNSGGRLASSLKPL
jgi:hypothetical protein